MRAIDEAGNVDQTPATVQLEHGRHDGAEHDIDAQADEPDAEHDRAVRLLAPPTTTRRRPRSPSSAASTRTAPADWVSCTNPKTYLGVGAGSHTFDVRATDAAGNMDATPASYTWTVNPGDTTPPDTVITQKPPLTTTETSATFRFNSTEADSTFECKLDPAPGGLHDAEDLHGPQRRPAHLPA